jgi:hypothetical protein
LTTCAAPGDAVLDGDLEHLSPVLSGHILLHWSHHFALSGPKEAARTTASLTNRRTTVLKVGLAL